MSSVKRLLIIINFFIILTLSTCVFSKAPMIVIFQVPIGVNKNIVDVYPNQTLEGYLVVESNSSKPLICHIDLSASNCLINYNGKIMKKLSKIIKLRIRYSSKVMIFNIKVNNEECELNLEVSCNGFREILRKILIPISRAHVNVILIAPSDSLCRFNYKIAKYTYVIVPGNVNPLLKLVSGSTGKPHPQFIGFLCVKVIGQGYYTVVILFRAGNRLAPISAVSPESSVFGVKPGMIVLEGLKGGEYNVVPLWTYVSPREIVGTYNVTVLVYPYGSSRPVLVKHYRIKIICLEELALILVLFSGLVAVPFFSYFTYRTVRKISFKDVAFCSLTSCLIFTTAVIPGYILWGFSAILGPFDWVLWGFVYDVLRMMYYGVALSVRPRPGTLSMIMLVTWILNVLYFGRMSILSLLWVATTAMFYEIFLLISRAYVRDNLSITRAIVGFIPATVIDNYVDLMLYMTLYRLYYADWYVALYVIGMTIYSIIGFILGMRISKYIRGVVHE
ncbi:MAG: hypothetical protein GXO10_01845 [Crenarchaeota archaeon]|nr:hypothetical protein [Thermoproteota archaeon]